MFNNWLEPQIEYLLVLQNFRELTNGFFDSFFMFITSLGEISIPTLLIAGIYWCINSRDGMYIMWNWSLGQFVCQFFKSIACIYRPWVLDSRIIPIEGSIKMSGGYSFPSGHSQTAVGVWGALAVCLKNKTAAFFIITLILLIAFSRNYIGVHTPQDVIFSLLIGVLLLFFSAKLMNWVEGGKNRDIIVVSSVILSSAALLIFEHTKSYPIDYVNGELLVDPIKMQVYTFPKIGLLCGTFTGWFVNRRFIGFDGATGSAKEKFIRYIIGAVFLSLIFENIRHLFDGHTDQRVNMFLSSLISSLFITCIYPWLICFCRKTFQRIEKKSIHTSKEADSEKDCLTKIE